MIDKPNINYLGGGSTTKSMAKLSMSNLNSTPGLGKLNKT